MKVIAVIEPACADTCLRRSRDRQAADRRPAVTCLPAGRSGRSARLSSRRSLDHLGLPTAAPQFRAPPDPPDALAAQQPREWSYEPVFDDLPIPDPLLL